MILRHVKIWGRAGSDSCWQRRFYNALSLAPGRRKLIMAGKCSCQREGRPSLAVRLQGQRATVSPCSSH